MTDGSFRLRFFPLNCESKFWENVFVAYTQPLVFNSFIIYNKISLNDNKIKTGFIAYVRFQMGKLGIRIGELGIRNLE